MARVMQHEPDAIEAFLRRTAWVPRFLAGRNAQLGRPLTDDEVADLELDVFAVIWRRLPDYEAISALENWVYGICSLMIGDAIRRKWRNRQRTVPIDEQAIAATGPSDVDRLLDAHEVEHLLKALGGWDAKVLRLKELDGLTHKEIAAKLTLPVNTVKTIHRRALERLREMLKRGRGEES